MQLTTGQVLAGRYRIVKLLGQGGFGAVYRAWHLGLNVPCALKENLGTSAQAARQFAREASMLATLRHPNLPRVTDHFTIAGQGQYLVMDFIEGKDLGEMLIETGQPLPEAQVLKWMSQICDALSYLHSQNPPIIHRDIKPANIKITPQGEAILVDFGIAKVYDANSKTTIGAQAITPGFSPFEQYGQGGTDARSDIYALGATMYNLLTGQEPPESIARLRGAPLPPLRILNPAITRHTERVILQALKVMPDQRFQTAQQMQAALEKSALPPRRSPVPPPRPPVKPPPPRTIPNGNQLPAWLWSVVGGMLVFLVVGIIGLWASGVFEEQTTPTVPVAVVTTEEPTNTPTPIPTVTRRPTNTPTTTNTPTNTPTTTNTPTNTPTMTNTPTVINTPTLIPTDTPTVTPIPPTRTKTPTTTNTPTPSPTSRPTLTRISLTPTSVRRIVFESDRDGNDEIYVMNADGSGLINLTNDSADDERPAWSPNGMHIAFHSYRNRNYEIYVMNSNGKNLTRLTNNVASDRYPTWSPDGMNLAFHSNRDSNWEIYAMDADGSKPINLTNNSTDDYQPAWSPDGTQIVFMSDRDENLEIYVMNADGSQQTNLTNNLADDYHPAWSLDGRRLAFSSDRDGNHEIYVMNANGSGLTRLTNNLGDDYYPAWSLDGTRIVFQSDRDGNDEIYLMNADGSGQINLTNNSADDTWPAWSP